MGDWPAWGGLTVAVGTLALTRYELWSGRRRQRQLGPHDELREALGAARLLFGDVIANGGHDADWFLADDRRETGEHLKDLQARVGDRELSTETGQVAAAWDLAFAEAPPRPEGGIRVIGGPDRYEEERRSESADRSARQAKVVEASRKGKAAASAAIARLNDLESHR